MKIIDFYFAAAIRKGSPVPPSGTNCEQVGDGLNYKLEWYWGEDSEHNFTIYASGEWYYEGPLGSFSGKQNPPHSKSWIRRMVKSGLAPDFAKCDWAEYYALRHP